MLSRCIVKPTDQPIAMYNKVTKILTDPDDIDIHGRSENAIQVVNIQA